MKSKEDNLPEIILIVGPTASGKSSLAMQLAQHFQAEIVVVDSVQVYKGFDLGTSKPSPIERELVPHHLLDLVSAEDSFNAADFRKLGRLTLDELKKKKKMAILVVGTGLYLHALLAENFSSGVAADARLREDLAKLSHSELQKRYLENRRTKESATEIGVHLNDKVRLVRAIEKQEKDFLLSEKKEDALFTLPPSLIFISIECPRPLLWNRIENRCRRFIDEGLLDEVSELLKSGVSNKARPMLSIGYKEAMAYLSGGIKDKETLVQKMSIATRQYAKRQATWFKKLEKNFEGKILKFQTDADQLPLIEDLEGFLGSLGDSPNDDG